VTIALLTFILLQFWLNMRLIKRIERLEALISKWTPEAP